MIRHWLSILSHTSSIKVGIVSTFSHWSSSIYLSNEREEEKKRPRIPSIDISTAEQIFDEKLPVYHFLSKEGHLNGSVGGTIRFRLFWI